MHESLLHKEMDERPTLRRGMPVRLVYVSKQEDREITDAVVIDTAVLSVSLQIRDGAEWYRFDVESTQPLTEDAWIAYVDCYPKEPSRPSVATLRDRHGELLRTIQIGVTYA